MPLTWRELKNLPQLFWRRKFSHRLHWRCLFGYHLAPKSPFLSFQYAPRGLEIIFKNFPEFSPIFFFFYYYIFFLFIFPFPFHLLPSCASSSSFYSSMRAQHTCVQAIGHRYLGRHYYRHHIRRSLSVAINRCRYEPPLACIVASVGCHGQSPASTVAAAASGTAVVIIASCCWAHLSHRRPPQSIPTPPPLPLPRPSAIAASILSAACPCRCLLIRCGSQPPTTSSLLTLNPSGSLSLSASDFLPSSLPSLCLHSAQLSNVRAKFQILNASYYSTLR